MLRREGRSMLEKLRRDRARYRELEIPWHVHPGFWIGAIFRLGAWARALRNPLFRLPLMLIYRVAKQPWRFFLNVELPVTARVGGGLCLVHPRNILIGAGCEIGEDCVIFHEVTLGRGAVPGLPRIGNKVHIFVGARVLGPVTVGDGSMIGANCVVTRNVPPDSVVAQAPNRVMPLQRFAQVTKLGQGS
jgi:serine O-acetyltransferase